MQYTLFVLPLLLGFLAVWLLMPRGRQQLRFPAVLAGGGGLFLVGLSLLERTGGGVEDMLFYLFAGVAIISGVCMILQQNPVYAALWFALVILSTCGLFLLLSASFLAAATIIVYAGAIIVTFLFVIMLAQQTGLATYDRRAREPFLACLGGFILLGSLLYTLQRTYPPPGLDVSFGDGYVIPAPEAGIVTVPENIQEKLSALSKPAKEAGHVASLGRSLFGDYLWSVEIAGTLLLVATIGAIAISARRTEVLR